MDTARVTTKGQLVVPARLRRKYGIKPGTEVNFIERDDQILFQPVTKEYIRSVRGMLRSSDDVASELLRERRRDRRARNASLEAACSR